MDLFSLKSFLVLFVLAVVFLFLRIIYRLTLHPLAKFPGPKLAAVSSLYAIYYDLVRKGKYVRHFPDWHDQYGPIIRIFPNQLHIRDIDSYNDIYKIGTKFEKQQEFYRTPFLNGSHLNIAELKLAKQRKEMFQPYFSKASIQRLEPLLKGKCLKFSEKLREAAKQNKAVNLSWGYRCLTADTIMDYSYQKPLGALDAPDFDFQLIKALDEFAEGGIVEKYFVKLSNLIFDILQALPPKFAKAILPPIASVQWLKSECRKCVLSLKNNPRPADAPYPSVFETMLNPNREKGQYTPTDDELTGEALLIFGAGMDTTSNTLVQGTWRLINDSRVLGKLQAELRQAMPDPNSTLTSTALESLPYLRGVVKESLRFAYGVPGRLPRVVPPTGATICGQIVPPGTVVSHSSYCYHTSDSIFKDAATFNPDRWLGDDYAELDKHMLAFSRGSRACLGINLAHAELYLTFAAVFRNFAMTPFETSANDIDWDDAYVPVCRGKLKVTIKELDE